MNKQEVDVAKIKNENDRDGLQSRFTYEPLLF